MTTKGTYPTLGFFRVLFAEDLLMSTDSPHSAPLPLCVVYRIGGISRRLRVLVPKSSRLDQKSPSFSGTHD